MTEAIRSFFHNVTWEQTVFAVTISVLVTLGIEFLFRPLIDWRKNRKILLVSLNWVIGFNDFKANYRMGPNSLIRLKNELQRAVDSSTNLEAIRPDSTFISRVRAACQSTLENVVSGNIKKFSNTNQSALNGLMPDIKKLNFWSKK